MDYLLEFIKEKRIFIIMVFLVSLCGLFFTLYVTKASATEAFTCPKIDEKSSNESNTEDMVTIDIKGAVVSPGVYRVPSSSIVNDVITLAGGKTSEADTSNLNLSKKVSDEMVITVYTKDEIKNETKQAAIQENNNDTTTTNSKTSSLISINTGSLEELESIPGIGESKAKLIIQYRESCGKFTKKEELMNIKGIGESVYAKLKDYITI